MMARLLKGSSGGKRYVWGEEEEEGGVRGPTLGSLDTSWSLGRALLSGNNQLPTGQL